jgi:hypothetical protein
LTREARCPYCLAALFGGSTSSIADAVVACASCGTDHHQACFLEHGRCTVLGCRASRFRADPGAARVVGSLHPFLPLGPRQRLRRSAGFLSVRPPQVDRVRRADVVLRLTLPPVAVVGHPLEGTLVVETPEPIRGQGLRLRLETRLHGPDGPARLRREEAALVGGAARSWLERLRLWSAPRKGLLLARGRTTFHFALHVDALRWRGRLPRGAALGPRQTFVLTAELDAEPSVASASREVALADGRRWPAALTVDGPPPTSALGDVTPPALGRTLPRAWTACPVRTSREAGPALALAAVRRRASPSRSSPKVDTIDLALEPLGGGPPVVRGTVSLALHARALAGALVVEVTTERRGPADADWVLFAREEVVLAGPSSADQDVSGHHRLAFELTPGPAFGARGRDRRRLRLQAVLLFAGLPLRSREHEVVLAPVRRRGARR